MKDGGKQMFVFILGTGALFFIFAGVQRYPVGQLVSASVYTEPYDPCDPAYKFLQPPPKDWAEKFGYNERTALIHAVSELRVVVAGQSQRLVELENGLKDVDWDLLPRKRKSVTSESREKNELHHH